MTTNDIRNIMNVRPFKPFAIHTTGGEAIIVPHPDYVLFPPARVRTTTFIVYDQQDQFHMLDFQQVAEVREHRS